MLEKWAKNVYLKIFLRWRKGAWRKVSAIKIQTAYLKAKYVSLEQHLEFFRCGRSVSLVKNASRSRLVYNLPSNSNSALWLVQFTGGFETDASGWSLSRWISHENLGLANIQKNRKVYICASEEKKVLPQEHSPKVSKSHISIKLLTDIDLKWHLAALTVKVRWSVKLLYGI